MACEDETTLLKYAAGTLEARSVSRVVAHLDTCADCRRLVALAAGAGSSADAQTQTEVVGAPRSRHDGLSFEAGTLIGRYRLLERVGMGGMGVVWAAYDPQLHRKVALKLLAASLDPESDLRVLREAQALAQLSHVNVVTVHDAGSHQGFFFIAMELVEGTTLHKWLRQRHSWRDVVAMFVKAGRGLAAAHALGLVHRDFKPGNVLISNDGEARVGDFGLARLAPSREPNPSGEQTPLTAQVTTQDMLVGTPGFAAPELLGEGVATAQSDQFSFCVSLYQGLFGVLPFPGDTLIDCALAARNGQLLEPPAGHGVPRRVVELVRQGLAAQPLLRHPSLNALLDRLADDPTRTRRAWAGAAAAVAALVVAVGARAYVNATACDFVDGELTAVWNPSVAAKGSATFTASQKSYAAETWTRTRERLDRYAAAWRAERAEACAAHQQGSLSALQYASRVECLDERRDGLKALVDVLGAGDPVVVGSAGVAVSELASLEACRAPSQGFAGQVEGARELKAELIRASTLLNTGQHKRALELLEPLHRRAQGLKLPALIAESGSLLGAAQRAVGADDCLETWERSTAAAVEAGDEALQLSLLSDVITQRGWILGKPAEARALYPLADGIARRVSGRNRVIGRMRQAQSDVEWQDGKREEALALTRRALVHFEREPGAVSIDAAAARGSIGYLLMELGQLQAAKEELDRALSIGGEVYGEGNPALHPIESYRSEVLREQGELEAAARGAEKVLAQGESLGVGPRLLPGLVNLAQLYGELQRGTEALVLLDRADAMAADEARAHLRPEVLGTRGAVERFLGHLDRAIRLGREAVALTRKVSADDHAQLVHLLYELAKTELAAGHIAEARLAAGEALKTQDAAKQVTGPQRGRLLSLAGRSALAAGDAAQAMPLLTGALALFDAMPTFDPFECGTTRLALADAQWRSGKTELAKQTARAALVELQRSRRSNASQPAQEWIARHDP